MSPSVFISISHAAAQRRNDDSKHRRAVAPPRETLLLSSSAPAGFADVVFRFGDAHEPLIKPTNDVFETLDAMPGLARARELVRLVREAHHHRRYLPILQRAEHRLTTRSGRRAPVSFTKYQHQWRLDLVDVRNRRTPYVILRVLKRWRLEPRRLKQREVRRVPPVSPTRDVALRYCRRESRRLHDGPVRQQATAAAARHTHLLIINVTAFDQLIDTGHQIFVIIAGIVVLNDVSKLLSVARAAARIRIKHYITLRRHPLKLVIEDEPVSSVRAAVYVQDERILLVRIEVRWLLHPRLNLLTVKTRVPDFFRLGEIQFREKLVVDMRELSRLAASFVEPVEIADACRR